MVRLILRLCRHILPVFRLLCQSAVLCAVLLCLAWTLNPAWAKKRRVSRAKKQATPAIFQHGRVPLAFSSQHQKKLKQGIDRLLRNRKLRGAKIGLVVMTRRGKVLYKRRANKLYIPASNTKIFTLAAALHKLGPHYRFVTKIYGDRAIDAKGVLKGDLYIRGSGDPMLRSEEMWRITRDLYNLGLRKVTGRVVFDDSFFDRKRFGKGWKDHNHERYRPYLAAIGALSMNFNTIAFTVRPGQKVGQKASITLDPPSRYIRKVINKVVTVAAGSRVRVRTRVTSFRKRDRLILKGTAPLGAAPKTYWRRISYPGWYTAYNLAAALRQQGIRVSLWPRKRGVPARAVELYRFSSPSLSSIVQYAGKHSSNFVTEQLLKTLGAEHYKSAGSWSKGLKVIKTFLKSLGLAPKSYVMVNGSGLGRTNRFSPMHIATVLRKMLDNFYVSPDFLVAQPIAGVDGTLRHRMQTSAAKGLARAKTGTIDGVSTLSGYVQTKEKQLLIFSICMNGRLRQNSTFRRVQDKITTLLASYPWRKAKP